MAYRWVPVIGEFTEAADEIIFHGKPREIAAGQPATAGGAEPPTKTVPSLGIYVSDRPAGDGTITADVTFDDFTPESFCEFILTYDVETKAQLNCGLGGGWSMFAIRRWTPSPVPGDQGRWDTDDAGGERSNLVPGRTYRLQAQLFGSRVRLAVDGVDVAATHLREPLPTRGQVGLFCGGYSKISIRSLTIDTESAKAFVVMQFSSPFNEIYGDVIKKACEDHSLKPFRADEMYGPGIIIKDIADEILRSQLVIADVTPLNQNVYFEVGYAHGVNKPIILLAEKGTILPFDISGFRTLFYENSIAGRARFDDGLRKHLGAIVGRTR